MSTAFLPWWAFSVIAAVIWGIHFNLIARTASVLPENVWTAITIYFLPNIPLIILLPLYYDKLWSNFQLIAQAGMDVKSSTMLLTLTSIAATCCLYIAIHSSKNATMASLIDMSYPLFVAIFAFLLFGQNHITAPILAGGALIIAGVVIIAMYG